VRRAQKKPGNPGFVDAPEGTPSTALCTVKSSPAALSTKRAEIASVKRDGGYRRECRARRLCAVSASRQRSATAIGGPTYPRRPDHPAKRHARPDRFFGRRDDWHLSARLAVERRAEVERHAFADELVSAAEWFWAQYARHNQGATSRARWPFDTPNTGGRVGQNL
jgi:hypothetical protein